MIMLYNIILLYFLFEFNQNVRNACIQLRKQLLKLGNVVDSGTIIRGNFNSKLTLLSDIFF